MKKSFRIIAADHTGITVTNLERSLVFWRDVLGFDLSHRAHQKGAMAQEITGVAGAEIMLAVLKTPGGHKIGKPQTLTSGPNAGRRVIYVRDPDGTTIEFMQPPVTK
jgi:catechol 2,3-dioxygenase-like lactoylglutathione lyase family enzyme